MYGAEAQTLYFRALADQSPVPVIMHNAPMATGVDLLPEIDCGACGASEHRGSDRERDAGGPGSADSRDGSEDVCDSGRDGSGCVGRR